MSNTDPINNPGVNTGASEGKKWDIIYFLCLDFLFLKILYQYIKKTIRGWL
jgi:hypothetical protein